MKTFNYKPNIKITQEKDYKGDIYFWWVVYDSDWTNQSIKKEGSAESRKELQKNIANAVAEIMLESGSTYGLGFN